MTDARRIVFGALAVLGVGALGFAAAYSANKRTLGTKGTNAKVPGIADGTNYDDSDIGAIPYDNLPLDVTAPPLDFDFGTFLPAEDLSVSNDSAVSIPRTTRGLRNRNPGNIRWIREANRRWRGMIRDDGTGYGVFDTDANGIRAIGKQLQVYQSRYGLTTIRAIITRWAPPSENVTTAYIKAVANALRIGADDPVDVSHRLPELVTAIIKHENGLQPYSASDIATWSRIA